MSIPTPFEDAGGASFTSLTDEGDWLALLESDSGTVSVTTVGTSVQGRPIRCVGVGYPTPPSIDQSPSVLVIATQHGHEPAPREAAMTLARDLAYTTDPDMQAYLADHPVFIIPTVNPDSLFITRNNAAGVDLNRDYFAFAAPESTAVSGVIRDLTPHVVVDMHEVTDSDLSTQIQVRGSTNVQVDSQLRTIGQNLTAYVRAELTSQGISNALYGGSSVPATLRNNVGLRGYVGFITETDAFADTPQTRHDACLAACNAVREFHEANLSTIAATIAAVPARKAQEGAVGATPFAIAPDVYIKPPRAYRITAEQYDALATQRDHWDLTVELEVAGTYKVTLGQPAQPLIVYALDPDSPEGVVAAERIGRILASPGEPLSYGPIRVGEFLADVVTVEMQVDGEMRSVWANPDYL